jgi:hypothetical protein
MRESAAYRVAVAVATVLTGLAVAYGFGVTP